MATRAQVEQYINFALSQLGAKNRHHEFEHLCRKYARQRICSNILPATGPVASGGDQGRDFETYITHVTKQLPTQSSWFFGLASSDIVVFACTTQQGGIQTKVQDDVTKICSGHNTPASIHILITDTLTVAKRHELQLWARTEHSVALEVHDRESLAENLCDTDTFWIAVEYLDVPREMYPDPIIDDQEYQKVRSKWSQPTCPPLSPANFIELDNCVQTLYGDIQRRIDAPFWLDKLKLFFLSGTEHETVSDISHAAKYEFIVTHYRVKGELEGQESLVTNFLESCITSSKWDMLLDATTVFKFALGAAATHGLAIPPERLFDIQKALCRRIEELLDLVTSPSERCWLLHTRGSAELGPDDTYKWWRKAAENAGAAPLYPITRLGWLITETFAADHDCEKWYSILDIVDEIVKEREGSAAAAANIVSRARKLHSAGKMVAALSMAHRSKIMIFNQEHVGKLCWLLLEISFWYAEIGYSYASKYYAAAAATLAETHRQQNPALSGIVRGGLIQCVECDYFNGSFIRAFNALMVAIVTEALFVPSDYEYLDDPIEDYHVNQSRTYLGCMLVLAREHSAAAHAHFLRLMAQLPAGGIELRDFEDAAREVFEAALRESLGTHAAFARAPFSDSVEEENVEWDGLGVSWRVSWTNEEEDHLALEAEGFVSTTQIILTEAALKDLKVVPGTCFVRIAWTDSEAITSHRADDGSWEIGIPRDKNGISLIEWNEQISSASLFLISRYVLDDDFDAVAESLVQSGILSNTLVVSTYAELCNGAFGPGQRVLLADGEPLQVPVGRQVPPELQWNSSPIEQWVGENAREILQSRYENAIKGTQLTLPKWLKMPESRAIVQRLRAEGWLDWQILSGVFSFCVTHWLGAGSDNEETVPDPSATQALLMWVYAHGETEDLGEVPIESLDEERLRLILRVGLYATLAKFGLVTRDDRENWEGVRAFLENRLMYFQDDIEHDDPFAV